MSDMKDLIRFPRHGSEARLFARQLNGKVYVSMREPTDNDLKLFDAWLKKAKRVRLKKKDGTQDA